MSLSTIPDVILDIIANAGVGIRKSLINILEHETHDLSIDIHKHMIRIKAYSLYPDIPSYSFPVNSLRRGFASLPNYAILIGSDCPVSNSTNKRIYQMLKMDEL